MLYIFDKDDKFISILTEETGLVDRWFKDYQNHIIDESFVFRVMSSSTKLKYIDAENQVAFTDRDGNLRLMRIKQVYEESSQEESVIRAICEPSYLELYDHFIEDKRITNGNAQTALNRALEGSRYVGEVTVELGLATDNFYWIDGIEAVFKIIETWGGALKDTIKLNDKNEIIERKLWIVQRLGADNGLIVEPDFNAESIERKTLSYVETALWGQGASLENEDEDGEATGGYTRYITFEGVVWSKAKGDPVDKPKGQKWVGDPQALNEFGYLHNGVRKHRFGHFSNQDYETPEELLMATWLDLQERKLKEIIHEASITAGDKKISLGDTVTILDRNYNKPIELQSQITGLEYDPLYPKDDVTIIIGKYIDMSDNSLQKEVDDLKDAVHKPKPTKPITDKSYPDIKPGTPKNVLAIGTFRAIKLDWDYDSAVYISYYEVYGSQIKDFVPDTQHLLYRGRVSVFGHEVGSNEMWYYRVRAVNTRGTASNFSPEVSASSTRIDFIDMADEIQEEIDDAKNRADEAVAKADNATANANDAIKEAQKGFDAAQDALGKSNAADSKAQQAMDKAQGSFDAAQSAVNKVDNLKIGTRNYLSNLAIYETDGMISAVVGFNEPVNMFTINKHGTHTRINIAIIYEGYMENPSNPEMSKVIGNVNFPYTYDDDKKVLMVILGNFKDLSGGIGFPITKKQFIDAKYKVELGNIPSDWSEAPEDVDQKIKVVADDLNGLSVTVSNNKNDVANLTIKADGLQTQVTNNKGDISTVTQLANGLQRRVADAEGNITTLTQTSTQLNSTITTIKSDLYDKKNILPYMELGGLIWASGAETDSTDRIRSDFVVVEPNTTYTMSVNGLAYVVSWLEYDSNKEWIQTRQSAISVYTVGPDTAYVRVVKSGSVIFNQKFQIEKGSKITPYAPHIPSNAAVNQKISVINQTVDSIATRVQINADNYSAISQTVGGIQTEVSKKVNTTTYNSKMTQLDSLIQSKVSQTDADKKYTQQSVFNQFASGFTARVEEIENWEFGGRNLITGSGTPSTFPVTDNDYNYRVFYSGLERNTTYTFSSKVEVLQGDIDTITAYPFLANGQNMTHVHMTIKNGRVEGTFTTDNRYDYNLLIYNGRAGATNGNRVRLIEYQLEKGNKATDWSPAPEDVEQKFSAINQTIDSISTRVQTNADNYSAMSQTVQGVQTTVASKADKSTVTQLAGVVDTKISTTDANGKFATQSQLTQTSSSLQSTITSVQQEIDGMVIGASNLITQLYDKWEQGYINTSTGNRVNSTNSICTKSYYEIAGDTEYTLTAYGDYEVVIAFYTVSNGYISFFNTIKTATNTRTFKSPSNATRFKVFIRKYGASEPMFYYLLGTLYKVQLERGNRSTDWTMGTTDLATQSQFSQLSDAINLRVTKGDLMSQINIDTSGVLISGKKLILDGDVTVTGGFRVNNANIVSIDAAKMTTGTLDAARINVINLNASNIKSGLMSVDRLTGLTANFVSTLWNGRTNEVQITGTGLATYSGGQRTSLLNGSGQSFYRDDMYIGHIGTSHWAGDTKYRGLRFGLENNANYMSWGFKEAPSDTSYTTMLAWHKTGTKSTKGFTFSDEAKFTKEVTLDTIATYDGSVSRVAKVSEFIWNGAPGFGLYRYSSQRRGAALVLGTTIATLMSNGNAYIEVTQDSTGNLVRSTDIYNRTYSAAANMHVTSYGTLGRSTSARKYKKDIEPITAEVADRFFERAEPVYYRPSNLTADDNKDYSYYGYIADDVAEFEPRLVTFNEKEEPEGFSYDRAPVLLHVKMKAKFKEYDQLFEIQQETINVLQQKIAKLEAV